MYLFKSASVLTISTICAFFFACPAASLPHSTLSKIPTQIEHQKFTRSSIINDYEKHLRTSVEQIRPLNKRGDDLDLVFFDPQEILIPLEVAAEILEIFYRNVASNARGPWASITPRIWIKISNGTLALLMHATEGNTIPWDFVARFALAMLTFAERGYTGMYTARFADPTGNNAIWVSLYRCAIGPLSDLAGVGAPATGTSRLNPNAHSWFPMSGRPSR